jgi:hypothetical protein
MIPMVVLAEILEEYLLENPMYHRNKAAETGHGQGVWGPYGVGSSLANGEVWQEFEGVGRLSEESGVPLRQISDIRRGYGLGVRHKKWNSCRSKSLHVSFDVADKLVCAMGRPWEWVTGRLAPFYGPIPVAGYERHLDVEAVAA